MSGDTIGEARDRVFNKSELTNLFFSIKCSDFNRFIHFAYYTGARSSEIRSLHRENIKDEYLVTRGKSGKRMVKLNDQAIEVLKGQGSLWNYSKDYIFT